MDIDYDLIDNDMELLEPDIINDDYYDQFVQTCPTCNSEKLFVNYEKVEVICNNCGLILKGTIELYNTSEKKSIEDKYNFKHFSKPVELKYDPFNSDLEFPEPPEFFYNEDELDYIDIDSLIDSYEIHEFDSNEEDEPDSIFEDDSYYDSYSDQDFLVDEECRQLLIDQKELILENKKLDDLYLQELNFEEEIMMKFAESLDSSKLKNINDESKILNSITEEKLTKNIESLSKPEFLKKKYIDYHSDESLKSIENDFDESDIVCHLIKTLKDSDPNVRREAAISLGIIGDVRAVKYLEEALKDPIMRVRESVKYTISKIKNENVNLIWILIMMMTTMMIQSMIMSI